MITITSATDFAAPAIPAGRNRLSKLGGSTFWVGCLRRAANGRGTTGPVKLVKDRGRKGPSFRSPAKGRARAGHYVERYEVPVHVLRIVNDRVSSLTIQK